MTMLIMCEIARETLRQHDWEENDPKCDRIDELTKWFYEYL